MVFNSQVFIFIFAPLAIGIYWLLPRRFRVAWLTLASYLFYAYWDWRFCGLLATVTVLTYACALGIGSARRPTAARTWFLIALLGNVGMLVWFKYAGLLAQTLDSLGGALHLGRIPVPALLFPVGLSFYVFQAISYLADVYRRRAAPTRSLLQFAAFVSLFPHLAMGPLFRWREVGMQLGELPQRLEPAKLNLGLVFFAAGLLKKVLVADNMAYFSDPLWLDWRHLVPGEAWAAALGYTVQLYFDFAGYSLMALGLGYLLGLDLPQNFNSPYRATDIGDFWRRWHMTLSFWLRDYLFTPIANRLAEAWRPLGFRRAALWGSQASLLVTFGICGLWHGAAWTYAVWGLYHGGLQVVHHWLRDGLKVRWRGGWAGRIGTLLLVLLGWVLFRAESFSCAGTMLKNMFDLPHLAAPCAIPKGYFAVAVPGLLWAVFAPNLYEFVHVRKAKPRVWTLIVLGILAAGAVLLLSDSSPFLYTQF